MIRLISDCIKQIVQNEGRAILSNPPKFEYLIKSALKELKKEAIVVSKLLEVNIPQSILLSSHRLDLEFYKSQFQIAFSNFRFSEDFIVTGLASWTEGLGFSYKQEYNAKALISGYANSQLPPCGNKVVHGLAELLFKYGQTTCFAKNWLEQRLKKAYPLYRGEVYLITSLLNLRVPQEMLELSKHDTLDAYILKIENRVLQEIPFDTYSLSWALDAWRFALGLEVPEKSSIFEKSIIKSNPNISNKSQHKQTPTLSIYQDINNNIKKIPSNIDTHSDTNAKTNSNINTTNCFQNSSVNNTSNNNINNLAIRPFFVYLLIFSCLLLLSKQIFIYYSNQNLTEEIKVKENLKNKLSPFFIEDYSYYPSFNGNSNKSYDNNNDIISINPKKLSSMSDDQKFDYAIKLFKVPTYNHKNKARLIFEKLSQKNYPGAKAFLAFMLIVGDGGDDNIEIAESIIDELVKINDLYQLKIFYELLCFSAIAGNPIAQKIIQKFKEGSGYFELSILPEKNFLNNLLMK